MVMQANAASRTDPLTMIIDRCASEDDMTPGNTDVEDSDRYKISGFRAGTIQLDVYRSVNLLQHC